MLKINNSLDIKTYQNNDLKHTQNSIQRDNITISKMKSDIYVSNLSFGNSATNKEKETNLFENIKNTIKNLFSEKKSNNIKKAFKKEKKLLTNQLHKEKNYTKTEIAIILNNVDEVNINLAKKLCLEKKLPLENIWSYFYNTNEENINFALEICDNEKLSTKDATTILFSANNQNKKLAKELSQTLPFSANDIQGILKATNEQNIELAQELCRQEGISQARITSILKQTNEKNIVLAQELCRNKDFPLNQIDTILNVTNEKNIDFATELSRDKDFSPNKIADIITLESQKNIDRKREIYHIYKKDKEFPKHMISFLLMSIDESNFEIAKELSQINNFPKEDIPAILNNLSDAFYPKKLFAQKIYSDKLFPKEYILNILFSINTLHMSAKNKYLQFYENNKEETKDFIGRILTYVNEDNQNFYDELNIADFKKIEEKIKIQQKKCLKNHHLYINGNIFSVPTINDYIKAHFKNVAPYAFAIFDTDTIDYLHRQRFNVAKNYNEKLSSFNSNELQILKDMQNCLNVNNEPFTPKQKIEMIDLICSYKENKIDFEPIKMMIEKKQIDFADLDFHLFSNILPKVGFTKDELQNMSKEKILAWDIENIHLLSSELQKGRENFAFIIKASMMKNNFIDYINETESFWGLTNQKTQEIYKKMGMNYNAWIKPVKENEIQFKSYDKNSLFAHYIASEIIDNIENLRMTHAKTSFDRKFNFYIKNNEFFIPNEIINNKEKFKNLMKNIDFQLQNLWERAENNLKSDNLEKISSATNILNIRKQLKLFAEKIDLIDKISKKQELDLTIKMWDRIPQKDIFQGNYSTCCIGMGEFHASAMFQYLTNTAFNMIELVDNNTGKIIGNALIYYIKTSENKPALVIDNVEINNNIKPVDSVGKDILNAIVSYAKNINKSVLEDENAHIYIGGSYNDVPISGLSKFSDVAKLIGKTNTDRAYMDAFYGNTAPNEASVVTLLELN